jgi:hemerythrin
MMRLPMADVDSEEFAKAGCAPAGPRGPVDSTSSRGKIRNPPFRQAADGAPHLPITMQDKRSSSAWRIHIGKTMKETDMAAATTLFLPWIDAYSVGIGVIDMQHKNLVTIINDLHQAMVSGHGKEELGTILSSLVTYTQVHFKTEETFMESHHYPEAGAHKTQHQQLTRTVLDLQRRFQKNEVGLTVDVMDFLKNWLSKHILGTDKRYSPFLNSKGVH